DQPRHPESLRSRAVRLGVDLDAAHVVVSVATDGGSVRQRAFSWAATRASTRGGLAAVRQNRVVLLLPGTDAGETARAVAKDLGRVLGGPATVGASGPVPQPTALAASFRDADR